MDIEPLLDELRQLAGNGLRYADNSWEEERWERVQDLVCEYTGESVELPSTEIRQRFTDEGGHVTTKVGAEAAIFNENRDVLVIKRVTDETWGMPGGWVDVGESPEVAAIREAHEETGLAVEPVELVDIYSRSPGEYGFHGQINVLYRCTVTGGEIAPSHEALAVQYRSPENVEEWHANHETMVYDALATLPCR